MLVAIADTHADGVPDLTPHLREAIESAEVVCHAGDFTSTAALETFEALADRLVAVHGNSDAMTIRERLPATATVDHLDRRFLAVHGHEHDRTTLSLLARQEEADVVVVGHTHRPGIEKEGRQVILNPGSHADPRGSRPAYVVVGQADGGVTGRIRTPEGDPIERVRV
jgi:putative phosphoesterase